MLTTQRRSTTLLSLAALVAVAWTGTASAQPIIAETFDTAINGWAFYNDGEDLVWDAAAGNPGGCARAADAGQGGYWGFAAGPAFNGNRACLYNGVLKWDLWTSHASAAAGAAEADVTIIGGGLTLVLDQPLPTVNVWNSYSATLLETAGWRKNTLAGAAPTQAEFQAALANITAIRFRAEFSTSIDNARIDNVFLGSFLLAAPQGITTCPGPTLTITTSITAGAANGPFTYRWRKDGVEIDLIANPSAGTPTLTIPNAQHADTGVYDCLVTNACGSSPSAAANVYVSCPNIADVALLGGAPGCDAQLSADDVVFYLTQFFANNAAVADVVGLGGSGGPDGQITPDDLVAFLAAFFTTCA